MHLQSQCLRGLLNLLCLRFGVRAIWIGQKRHHRRCGNQFAQKLQPLLHQKGGQLAHACDIPPRAVKACDQAKPDWVTAHCEYNRNASSGRLRRKCRYRPPGAAITATRMLARSAAKAGTTVSALRPAECDQYVEPSFLKALAECFDQMVGFPRRPAAEKSNYHHSGLCAGHARPPRRQVP